MPSCFPCTTTTTPTSSSLSQLTSQYQSQSHSLPSLNPFLPIPSTNNKKTPLSHTQFNLPETYFQVPKYTSPSQLKKYEPSLVNLSSFKKLKILGTGNVGRVYLVKFKNSNSFFALKVLNKQEMVKRNKLRRVLMEHSILSTLHHPFLIHLYHTFETPSHFYFCLEYCPGGDLYKLLRRVQRFTESQTRFFLIEIIAALHYLHLHDVLYRDLKPENVLLHGSGHIKLTDFDLSTRQSFSKQQCKKLNLNLHSESKGNKGTTTEPDMHGKDTTNEEELEEDEKEEEQNSMMSFVGTEAYVSPEIILGRLPSLSTFLSHSSSVSYNWASTYARIDWWSLGILMYECLVGYTPFLGPTPTSTFHNICHAPLRFPSFSSSSSSIMRTPTTSPVSLSKSAIDLMKGLLHKSMSKRFELHAIQSHPFFLGHSFAYIPTPPPSFLTSLIPKSINMDPWMVMHEGTEEETMEETKKTSTTTEGRGTRFWEETEINQEIELEKGEKEKVKKEDETNLNMEMTSWVNATWIRSSDDEPFKQDI